jgi:hypothetical protein
MQERLKANSSHSSGRQVAAPITWMGTWCYSRRRLLRKPSTTADQSLEYVPTSGCRCCHGMLLLGAAKSRNTLPTRTRATFGQPSSQASRGLRKTSSS